MRVGTRSSGRQEFGGFGYRRVKIVTVRADDGMARCRDSLGQEFQVTLRYRNGKGGWPQVGEEWFISKQFLGRWVFMGVVSGARPPVIYSPREGMDKGTEEIFDALIALGLVTEDGSDFERSED